jgi:O-antigen ligase
VQIEWKDINSGNNLNYKVLLSGLLLIIPLLFVLNLFSLNTRIVLIVLGLPLIAIFLFSFRAFKYLFILSLFTNYYLLGLYLTVFIAIGFLFSFLLAHTQLEYSFFKTPLTAPFLIYFISILPSFLNSSNVILSIYYSLNLFGIAILLFVFGYVINTYQEINKIIMSFIILCLLDAIVIIVYSLFRNGREYGLSGIVFVDYSAMGVLILLLFIVFERQGNIFLNIAGILVLLAGLIFTQTRNTFISLLLTSVSIFAYMIFSKKQFSVSKRRIIYVFTSIILISVLFLIVLNTLKPEVFQRFNQLDSGRILNVKQETDFKGNSILTRLLIWDTAWNAFKAHPIIGIGAYSFPFESVRYYTIPRDLYQKFVEGLSPHVTYIANLTETGILGFIGFVILMIASLKTGFKSVKLAVSSEQKHFSTILLTLQIYIFFSMFLTDAWLWGQCGMLWGMVMGTLIANNRIIKHANRFNLNAAK